MLMSFCSDCPLEVFHSSVFFTQNAASYLIFALFPRDSYVTGLPATKLATFPPPLSVGLGLGRHLPGSSAEPKILNPCVLTALLGNIRLTNVTIESWF